jgi:hypothetical protein
MKRIALLLLLTIAVPPAARADLCALDHAPAATLLLPYFEVDLGAATGKTTLFSINNVGAQPRLAHVTLWTDLGIPTLAFDVYLTGYDVQTVNLRDVFAAGVLPRTADQGRDPADTLSPAGAAAWDASFPGCEGLPPQALPASFLDHLQRAHSGRPSPLFEGKCAGRNLDQPQVMRGYATIDVVKSCTLLRPNDPGYFGAGGVAGFDNVLWGDFFYVDPAGSFAQGDDLVRIEADPTRFSAGGATFYGRYVGGTGADGREPLPTMWANRFLNGGPFSGGTAVVVWREVPWAALPFRCITAPAGFPLSQKDLVVFDEQEHPLVQAPFPIPEQPPTRPSTPFPGAASREGVGGPDLPLPYAVGWLLTDLAPLANEPADPYAQAWLGQVSSSQGRYSVGFQGTHLNSLCATAADRCPGGQPADVGQLCVGPTKAGQPARFTVTPKGCFSAACDQLFHAGCAVLPDGSGTRIDALLCVAPIPRVGPCINDCSGVGTASCDSAPLSAGVHTVRAGGLALNFEVPSATATCVARP